MRVGAMKEEKKIRKKIKIEDLLPRDPIRVDLDAILGYVKGKTILVTGGGGSIGSEICRQLAGHDVGHLIILTSTKTMRTRFRNLWNGSSQISI